LKIKKEKENNMAKKSKMIPVIFVETFKGGKYLFRTDKPYETEMNQLFASLIVQSGPGSICTVSKRQLNKAQYNETQQVKIMNGMLQTT
jgi:hypothetical protein